MKKKLIYICSPCRGNDGNYEHNIEMAQYYCRTVMHMFPNLLPIAPHVYFTQFLDDSILANAAWEWLRAWNSWSNAQRCGCSGWKTRAQA